MIHCTTENLLAVKGGEGTAWTRRHLAECGDCQREFDALHQRVARLKALPSLNPPRDRWPVIRERVLGERRQRRWSRFRRASLVLAASVAALVAVGVLRDRRLEVASTRNGDLQQLVSQSQQLEEALRELDAQSRVMSGAAASAAALLEDRIAAIDAQLGGAARTASRDEMADLWRRRVELMQGLVSVHATRVAYLGM